MFRTVQRWLPDALIHVFSEGLRLGSGKCLPQLKLGKSSEKFCSLLGFATKTGSILQGNGGFLHDPPDWHRSTKKKMSTCEKSLRVPLTVKKLLVLTLQLRQQGGDLSSTSRSKRMTKSNCATLGVHLTSMCSDPCLPCEILALIKSRTTDGWCLKYLCLLLHNFAVRFMHTVLIFPKLLACYGCIIQSSTSIRCSPTPSP